MFLGFPISPKDNLLQKKSISGLIKHKLFDTTFETIYFVVILLKENKNCDLFHKTTDNGNTCIQEYYCNDDN